MANPNRAFANMPKNPFGHDSDHRVPDTAHARAEAMKAEGWQVKVTRVTMHKGGWNQRTKQHDRPDWRWTVWFRAKPVKDPRFCQSPPNH